MRIQKQAETFTWRVARGYANDQEWLAHQQLVHDLHGQLGMFDSRNIFGNVNGKKYTPTDADRKMMYNVILQVMRETGGPENFAKTHGRGLREIPQNRSALLMAGVGGSGKGSVLKKIKELGGDNHFILNPDDIKVVMARLGMIPDERELRERYGIDLPGWDQLSPMERSPVIHEEASYLTGRLAAELQEKGYNVIHDGTLGKQRKVDELIPALRDLGYDPSKGGRINAALADIPPEVALQRAGGRHRGGQEKYYKNGYDQAGDYSFYNFGAPIDLSILGQPEEGDQGGRALPPNIHSENNIQEGDPGYGTGATSKPAGLFPYVQSLTDSSLHLDTNVPRDAAPRVVGGHGPDFQHLIPPDGLWVPGRTARFMFASEDGPNVRQIVRAFRQGDIDISTMVSAIAQRLQSVEEEEEEPHYHDAYVPYKDDAPLHLQVAVDMGALTEEQYEQIIEALSPLIFPS